MLRHFSVLWQACTLWIVCLNAFAAGPRPTDLDHPVKLVVPFPAGGSADVVARLIAKPLAQYLGQAVVVENKPGADGAIAAEAVSGARPDGCTLFFATYGAMSAVPHMHKSVRYDAMRDFTPISRVGTFSMMLFAHPSLGVQTVKQLEAYGQHHKGTLQYGTGNVASIIMGSALNEDKHLDMVAVPYKGEVPALNDFLAGRVQLMFATPTNTLPFVREGKLVAIAAMTEKRMDLLPQVPTWRESGMKEMPASPWAGVFGPAGMNPSTVLKINMAINAILNNRELQAEFSQQGFDPTGSTPHELETFMKTQFEAWRVAVQDSGLHPH